MKSEFQIGTNPVNLGVLRTIIQERPDIVHTQAPTIVADLSVFSCRLLGLPVVATYHAEITQSSIPRMSLKLYNTVHHNLTMRNCSKVIVTTKRYMIKLKRSIPESKICVIPVGIEKEFAETRVPQEITEELETRINRLGYYPRNIILFVGVLDSYHAYKGIENLLEAFKIVLERHKGSLLIIVGDGNRRPLYEALCGRLGLAHNALFMGFVARDTLLAIYSLCDALVLPSTSISEGFGTVLLEALSRGCPVITTIYAGGSEVVQQENAGIVINSPNPYLLSHAIMTLIENKSLAKKCAENGIRAIRQKYTWESLSHQILEIYKGCKNN